MSRAPLAAISSDHAAEVTWERIRGSLRRGGYTYRAVEDEMCLPLEFGGQSQSVCLPAVGNLLAVRTRWESGLPFEQVEYRLFAATDSWNRKHPFPTLYTVPDARGSAVIVADFSILVGDGLTDAQLDEAVEAGVGGGKKALEYLQNAAETVLGMGGTPGA